MEKASKNFISELKKQKRENKSLLFLDNVKIIKDALASRSILPKCILTSLDEEEWKRLDVLPKGFSLQTSKEGDEEKSTNLKSIKEQEIDAWAKSVEQSLTEDLPIFRVDEKTIEQLSGTKTPQKVLCIAYSQQHLVQLPKDNFLVLDGLQDPGNVGTLIRTAKASGFEIVFLVDCVRKSNEKLIRSSVGAVLSSNVVEMKRADFVEFAKAHKLNLLCCDMNGQNIFSFKARGQVGVVVGNEGQGVSDEIRALCTLSVKIPMCAGIESLNAGVSGSIIMYEINKNKFV